ncbi:MAG: MFS transporter, partial [Clostridia bacterium]
MKRKKGKLEWRRLDNSAKIFPISTGKKYSNVFRLSAVLLDNVNKKKLEEAVKNVLEKYDSFKVR